METATRTCCTCKSDLPLNDTNFAADVRPYQGGFVWECRTCAAARMATWRRANPKAAAASTARRRQRERAIPGELTVADRQFLLEGSGGHCAYPGCKVTKVIFDHIRPTTAAGCSHGPLNRQPMCPNHNRRKAQKVVDYRPMCIRLSLAREVLDAAMFGAGRAA